MSVTFLYLGLFLFCVLYVFSGGSQWFYSFLFLFVDTIDGRHCKWTMEEAFEAVIWFGQLTQLLHGRDEIGLW